MYEAFKVLRGCLFQCYWSSMQLTIAEAVTERLFGRSHARSVDAGYRVFAHHAREQWVPQVPADLPCGNENHVEPLQPPLNSRSPPASPTSVHSWFDSEFDSDDDLPVQAQEPPAGLGSGLDSGSA